MLALVDYGAGNLTSVRKGFAAAGAALSPARIDSLDDASGIVIPGVGHFGSTTALQGAWTAAIRRAVARGVPVLGICLGMQWLFEGSDEAPGVRGLGVLDGRCVRLAGGGALKVPHVGWNSVRPVAETSRLLRGVEPGAHVYFTHTFAAPITGDTAATVEHGTEFAAAVERGRIFGVQFHPEKSGAVGSTILRNFIRAAHAR